MQVEQDPHFYFFDNGVRNSLIQNFNLLSLRNDTGQLWENFLGVERRKTNQAAGLNLNSYFWRTYDQKEIDCIEERGGSHYGYKFKWQAKALRRSVRDEFLRVYPGSELQVIHYENFEEFITSAPV